MLSELYFLNIPHAFQTLPLLPRLFSPTWFICIHCLRSTPVLPPLWIVSMAKPPCRSKHFCSVFPLQIICSFILALIIPWYWEPKWGLPLRWWPPPESCDYALFYYSYFQYPAVMHWTVYPPNSYVEALAPSVMVFGDGGLWEVIRCR